MTAFDPKRTLAIMRGSADVIEALQLHELILTNNQNSRFCSATRRENYWEAKFTSG